MRSFRWQIFLSSARGVVYQALSTDEGRAKFWAERSVEQDGVIRFFFPDGSSCAAKILQRTRPSLFVVQYFEAKTTFSLSEVGSGTVVTLSVEDAAEDDWLEAYAGWVSVLMNMKAVLDFGCDLRNHDPSRSWDQGFVDN